MSADKLAKIQAYIDGKLPTLEAEYEEINEMMEDEFNPSDWSGGNFDDAYFIGEDHGDTSGQLRVLYGIQKIIDGEDE